MNQAKLHWTQILVNRRTTDGRRESTAVLRRAMAESGIPYRCAICNCWPVWQGGTLILQIDHINGDPLNNERSNLRFLCPNCHSQTETFGSKNRGRTTEEIAEEIQAWVGDANMECLVDETNCEIGADADHQEFFGCAGMTIYT